MIMDQEARALFGRLVDALAPLDGHRELCHGGVRRPDSERVGVGFTHAEAREAKAARKAALAAAVELAPAAAAAS